ncbi:MAG: hypothetical protein J07HX64_00841 [halophilic archaeon J07HX64]|jgi:hypothetical protein|nr:MAG: hypothetical protein J07HX64_00841 [halophilic archaeon J07HX64]
MSSEQTRRLLLSAAAGASVTALAGCLGDRGSGDSGDDSADTGGNGDTEQDGGDGGTDADDSTDEEDAGRVSGEITNSVDGLAIAEWEVLQERLPEEWFSVLVVVENTGERETEPFNYYYDLVPFDADGNDISTQQGTAVGDVRRTLSPGEQGEVNLDRQVTADPTSVVEVDLTLGCQSEGVAESEGVYCR